MKKYITTLVLALSCFTSFAHYLWVDTAPKGNIGKTHEVKVHFGEYTYGVIEKVAGEAFPAVANFSLWLIHPDGTKTVLETQAKDNHYLAQFSPTTNGVYTIALNNNEIDVIDYTQYDFGIFKTHYHSTAKVQIGSTNSDTKTINPDGIAIKQLANTNDKVTLQVLYKNAPLTNHEVKIYVADLWSKTLETNAKGNIEFTMPWNTKFIIETTKNEEVPGIYKNEKYEFIWHCATYCINNQP